MFKLLKGMNWCNPVLRIRGFWSDPLFSFSFSFNMIDLQYIYIIYIRTFLTITEVSTVVFINFKHF